MKSQFVIVIALLSLVSCSKNEADPDLTQQYVGSWKTEVQRTTQQVYWTSYEIKRVSNSLLTIKAGERWESLQGEFDDYTDEYILDSLKVNSDQSIHIKSSRVLANGQELSYDGSGEIVNDTLTIRMIMDYDNMGNDIPTVMKLTKQQ
jgi:hypothetical protein